METQEKQEEEGEKLHRPSDELVETGAWVHVNAGVANETQMTRT